MFQFCYLLNNEIEEMSEIFRVFEFKLIFFDPIKQSYESFISSFDLNFHFGGSISMPKNRNNRSELFYFRKRLVDRRSELILGLFYLIQRSHLLNSCWEKVIEHFLFEYCRTIFPILRVAFNKRPSIYIANIAATVASK